MKSGRSWTIGEKWTRTHSAEHTRDLQYEVELGAARYLAGALCGLQCLRLQLGKEKRQTEVVVVGIPDALYCHSQLGGNDLQGRLRYMQ